MPKRYHYTKKTGRPSKYDPAYGPQLIAFCSRPPYRRVKSTVDADGTASYETIPNDPPLLIDFARSIGVRHCTLLEWAKTHPDFSEALTEAKELQHKYYVTCGVLGLTNAMITALILKNNHGYRDHDALPAPPSQLPLPKFIFYIGADKPKILDSATLVQQARIRAESPEISTNGEKPNGATG